MATPSLNHPIKNHSFRPQVSSSSSCETVDSFNTSFFSTSLKDWRSNAHILKLHVHEIFFLSIKYASGEIQVFRSSMEKILSGFCFFFTSFLFHYFNFLGKWRVVEKVEDEPDERLSQREVKMVMERLGIEYGLESEEVEEMVGVEDFRLLFDGDPSSEEMKKVFEVWDENGDGFIDAGELESVLCKLGMEVGSEPEDYTRMIGAVDEDGDGVVNFDEFLKFMDKC